MVRFKLEDIAEKFAEQGYEIIDTKFKNAKVRMQYRCSKHSNKVQLMSFDALRKGVRCAYCSGRLVVDLEDAQILFKSKGYELLEEEFLTLKTRMRFTCPKHSNEETYISVESIRAGGGCYWCGRAATSEKRRVSYADIKKSFRERGYELITKSAEYENNKQLLDYVCPDHPERARSISYNNLARGAGCMQCSGKDFVDMEVARKAFAERGLQLLETEYLNTSTGMRYKCLKHPEIEQKLRYNSVQQGVGCRLCAVRRGEESSRWQGGVTSLNAYLRDKVNVWRYAQIRDNGSICDITGSNCRTDLHHLKPFYQIRDEALTELGLGKGKTVSDYTQDQIDALTKLVVDKHDNVKGVSIRTDIHILFHSMYGHDTDEADYLEFKENYLEELAIA